jgi:hypothetical protein
MDLLKPIVTFFGKIINWEGMAQLVKAFGDKPALALVGLGIPFAAVVLIIGMVCSTLICRAKIKGEIDRELAKLTGVNPRRKRWWQFWK